MSELEAKVSYSTPTIGRSTPERNRNTSNDLDDKKWQLKKVNKSLKEELDRTKAALQEEKNMVKKL